MTSLAILAVAGLMALPIAINAQVKGAGAAKLTVPTAVVAPAIPSAMAMGCSDCRIALRTVDARAAKTGAARETTLIARKDCPDCENTIVTRGTGKLAKDTVVHACTMCSTASRVCCAK